MTKLLAPASCWLVTQLRDYFIVDEVVGRGCRWLGVTLRHLKCRTSVELLFVGVFDRIKINLTRITVMKAWTPAIEGLVCDYRLHYRL